MKKRVVLTLLVVSFSFAMVTGLSSVKDEYDGIKDAPSDESVTLNVAEGQTGDFSENETGQDADKSDETNTLQEEKPEETTPEAVKPQGEKPEGTTPQETKPESAKPKETTTTVKWTVTRMDATLYSQANLRVRSGPNTTYDVVGSYSLNEQVIVTGKCEETGWYRVKYNGFTAYASCDYLAETKVSVEVEPEA